MNSRESVPVGYRFRPTDEELVNHYLKKKMLGLDNEVKAIPEIDICKWEPWDLPTLSMMKPDDTEWFFFSPVGFKYAKGKRFNRATEAGYWKVTGNDRKIKGPGGSGLIATKKTLVFHRGRVPNGVGTNWVMHEYHPVINFNPQREFVLCRLKKKADKVNRAATSVDGEPSGLRASELDSIPAELLVESQVDEEPLIHVEPELSGSMAELWSLLGQVEESPVIGFQSTVFDDIWTGGLQLLQEASEEEIDDEEFVNSLLVGGDHSIHQGRSNSCLSDFNQPESFRMVDHPQHMFSSDTDVESTMYNQFLGRSSFSDVHTNSNVHRLVRTTEQPRRGPSPTKFQYIEEENVHRIMCITKVESSEDSSPCITPPSKSKDFNVPHSSARRVGLQKRSPFKSEKPKEPEVCHSTTKSSMSASGVSSGSDGKHSPVILQTCRVSLEPSAPYINLFNVILGVLLFVVFLREMLLFGDW